MTNHTKPKKPLANKSKRKTTTSEFLKNLKIVDNIPEGGELVINTAEFVRLFKKEIIKKCFKKPGDKTLK
jgi:hypothetical protein